MRIKLSNKVKVFVNAFIKGMNRYNIQRPFEEQVSITVKRVQILLFFCEIEYMNKHNGTPLFEDDFYAWPAGPAIPLVYNEMLHADCNGMIRGVEAPSKEEQELVNYVLEITNNLDRMDLVKACWSSNSPWEQLYDSKDKLHKQVISKNIIYEYYINKDLKTDILKIR